MDVNWNDTILGLRMIEVRDFLRTIKFDNYYVDSISSVCKLKCDSKLFLKELIKKDLIKIKMGRENKEVIELTENGISLTTKQKIKQRDKSYCKNLIEEIKSRALLINNDNDCPEYISKISVFGSYLYKKNNEMFNDLDIIISLKEKKFLNNKEFNDKSDAYISFCDINELNYSNHILGEFERVNIFIKNSIKNKNSFIHIQSEHSVPKDWKQKIIFNGIDNSK
jgi:hypothetical protein